MGVQAAVERAAHTRTIEYQRCPGHRIWPGHPGATSQIPLGKWCPLFAEPPISEGGYTNARTARAAEHGGPGSADSCASRRRRLRTAKPDLVAPAAAR